jgi:hypothetical protein
VIKEQKYPCTISNCALPITVMCAEDGVNKSPVCAQKFIIACRVCMRQDKPSEVHMTEIEALDAVLPARKLPLICLFFLIKFVDSVFGAESNETERSISMFPKRARNEAHPSSCSKCAGQHMTLLNPSDLFPCNPSFSVRQHRPRR